MSDLWTFPSPPPIIHHSSQSNAPSPFSSPVLLRNHGNPPPPPSKGTSPQPCPSQVTSPDVVLQTQMSSFQVSPPQVISPNMSYTQMTYPNMSHPQVSSPHMSHPQVSSPLMSHPQVSSPHMSHPQVSSPHMSHPQVSSPHMSHPQVTSPHMSHPQVSSPHMSHPQVSSPLMSHPQVSSPHMSHPQVSSPHMSHPQVSSPHMSHPQVSSPHMSHPQVSSPHMSHPQVTSPLMSHPQVSPPHMSHPQVSSPHMSYPQVTSPHMSHPQVSSPHMSHPQVSSLTLYQSQMPPLHPSSPQVNSPNHLPPAQVNPPLFSHPHVTSPHLMPPAQHLLFNQHPDPELNLSTWNQCEPSADLTCFLNGGGFPYQTAPHVDLHLQNLNQFGLGEIPRGDEPDNTFFNNHTLDITALFEASDAPGPDEQTLGGLVSPVSQLHCSPLGSTSAGAALGNWRSNELSSSSAEIFPRSQFFFKDYRDGIGPEPFCSPTTPGPGPHYPQSPAVSSPGLHLHPTTDRMGFSPPAATRATQLNRDLPCVASKTGQQRQRRTSQHRTSQRLPLSRAEQDPDPGGLQKAVGISEGGGQESGRTGPSLQRGVLTCRSGRGGGRAGPRGNSQTDVVDRTWVKQMQRESSSEVPDFRLLCMVCKRDFKSLPALNGHMRSHSGFRSPTLMKKDSPPPQHPVSMVMPVSVPVRTRGVSTAGRRGQRRCALLRPATRGAALFRSLMHLELDGEAVARGDAGDRFTPAPMLSPQRPGPGLFCSLATRGQQTQQTRKVHDGLCEAVAVATPCPPPGTLTLGILKPKINVGRSFQAEIPPLRDRDGASSDSHDAELLWTPWDELEHPVSHQRVEALLMMARSSVVPGGGVGPEHTLHILSESRGDFLATVEKLLSSLNTHLTGSRCAAGARWSAAERRQLLRSLQLHRKDFSSIQKAVQTKTVSECVEFYYLWKKKLFLGRKPPTVTLPDSNSQRLLKSS
ncbi:mucin-2-like [Cololabis saira]|uniref:mucin-2-like n=1 Tax=Cololabis saira TaxID=129043 RepID=UPI002AD4E6FA|nr:mucin-2-like [Cololabis saira]